MPRRWKVLTVVSVAAGLDLSIGRLANRLGRRVLAGAGSALSALGGAWRLWRIGAAGGARAAA